MKLLKLGKKVSPAEKALERLGTAIKNDRKEQENSKGGKKQ